MASSITPGRKTHVRFDVSEPTLREPPFAVSRSAAEMARSGSINLTNVSYLDTGAWTLTPYNDDTSNLHTGSDPYGAILKDTDFTLADGVVGRPTWKAPTDLTGVTTVGDIAPTGDMFLVNTVAAGANWAKGLTDDEQSFGKGQPLAVGLTYDRIAITNQTFPNNQAFLIRCVIRDYVPHSQYGTGTFFFGGPIDATNGPGQFNIAIGADGNIGVWEMVTPYVPAQGGNPAIPAAWVIVDYYKAFSRGSTTQVINMRVWPHYTANGTPCIQIVTDVTAQTTPNNLLTSVYAGAAQTNTHTTYLTKRAPSAPATGEGPVRVDMPRPQRVPFQVSVLRYKSPGTIIDDAFALPFFPNFGRNPLTLSWRADTPNGTTVDGALFDGTTGAELTLLSTIPNGKVYQLNKGQYFYFAKFVLTADAARTSTPFLYSYQVIRDSWVETETRSEYSFSGRYPALRTVNISGPERDITHETASLTIEDPTNALPLLRTRTRIHTIVETEYDPLDSTKRSILFEGYVDRPDALHRGNAGTPFPSSNYYQFSLILNGMWRKIKEKISFLRITLGHDPNTNPAQPYKVTDIVRSMLGWCGFASDQIDVPDSPIRFYPSQSGSSDELLIDPLSDILEQVEGFLKDYLGWFLLWDANAGSRGMIRARPPALAPYNNLAGFYYDLPSSGYMSWRPETYGTTNWVAPVPSGGTTTPVYTFIRKKTFKQSVKSPEGTALCVTGTGSTLPNKSGEYQNVQWALNVGAYNAIANNGGATVATANQSSADYIGEFIPIVRVDLSLNSSAGSDYAIKVVTRRIYDVSMHTIDLFSFEAPLLLVWDGNDPYQTKPRPLRFYDPVTIISGGVAVQCIVRNCNPVYRRDHVQMATYEVMTV